MRDEFQITEEVPQIKNIQEIISQKKKSSKREEFIKNVGNTFKKVIDNVDTKNSLLNQTPPLLLTKNQSVTDELIRDQIEQSNQTQYQMQIKEEQEEEAEKIKKKFDSIERIVITGAAGYLGSYLIEEAVK